MSGRVPFTQIRVLVSRWVGYGIRLEGRDVGLPEDFTIRLGETRDRILSNSQRYLEFYFWV